MPREVLCMKYNNVLSEEAGVCAYCANWESTWARHWRSPTGAAPSLLFIQAAAIAALAIAQRPGPAFPHGPMETPAPGTAHVPCGTLIAIAQARFPRRGPLYTRQHEMRATKIANQIALGKPAHPVLSVKKQFNYSKFRVLLGV